MPMATVQICVIDAKHLPVSGPHLSLTDVKGKAPPVSATAGDNGCASLAAPGGKWTLVVDPYYDLPGTRETLKLRAGHLTRETIQLEPDDP